ncbi:DNA-binding response OmpR family regulator [Leptothrix sp. C29]|uniref:DNA-binding response OmpR family regulator n=1 Tax=Sphaerotilus uruguayifluvii TaxID=2735897 RepID=A0ABX2G965_9BURK|nr:response regulator [Leptothrix sp. C29]NRT57984.1 DNA-binding response OmpR family regulator [Leptothrix sp. C29]
MSIRRILIVEDQIDIRRFIRMTLEMGEHELHEAADGESALAQAQALRPDLVLLDVMMPGALDGLEVCRRLRADPRHAGLKVLLLSARGRSEDLEAGRQAGADACLVKPFSPIDLLGRVEAMLEAGG